MEPEKRALFKEAWDAIGKTEGDAHARIHAAYTARDALIKVAGAASEPFAWCESCGMPFFEGDDYATGEDVSTCWRMTERGNGPCYDPEAPAVAAE